MIKPSETSDILQQQLDNVDLKAEFEEIGTVLEVGDGVANVFGLDNVTSGELIEFENGVRGVAMNLSTGQGRLPAICWSCLWKERLPG